MIKSIGSPYDSVLETNTGNIQLSFERHIFTCDSSRTIRLFISNYWSRFYGFQCLVLTSANFLWAPMEILNLWGPRVLDFRWIPKDRCDPSFCWYCWPAEDKNTTLPTEHSDRQGKKHSNLGMIKFEVIVCEKTSLTKISASMLCFLFWKRRKQSFFQFSQF